MALKTYYCDKGAIDRFNQFVKNRFGSSDKIASVTNSLLENDETVDILGVGIISILLEMRGIIHLGQILLLFNFKKIEVNLIKNRLLFKQFLFLFKYIR
ncbi:hypothetical protein EfmJHP36_31160 (plasmid) [Enterococcus faecium]|nr:hypothetical protein EfmJHP36_31160 [Enterococcus faecium]